MNRILITSLAVMFLMTSVFLNIDRSRSTYVLSWVKSGAIQKHNEEWIVRVKSKEAENLQAVILRVTEASRRELISINDNKVELTFLGSLAFNSFNFTAKMFNLEGWFENID
jgi:hypothetical protein